jgi:hypothetical protein
MVRGLAVSAVALTMVPAAGYAGNADDANETVLEAEPMLSAEYDIGDTIVIRATVVADGLIKGHVEARGAGASFASRAEIEVAGGATKEFILLLPTTQFADGRVTVEVFDGSKSIDSDVVTFKHDINTDVAGVLPTLAIRVGDLPPRVTLFGDTKRVNMVAISADLLDQGAPALAQLDAIAATSDDLSQLLPVGRDALLGWLSRGGQLLLDDADDLSALPEAWRPGSAGYARADRGVVRLVEGQLSSADWADAIQPAPLAMLDNQFGFFGMDMVIDPRITLSQRAGVVLPNLNKILIALGAYVVVLGPIMYLVLRRARRLTAAWIAIPAVSILVAGAVVATGSSWRTTGRPTSSTVVELSAGASYAYNDTLLFRRTAGRSSLTLPAGWAAAEQNTGWFFGGEGQPANLRNFVTGGGERRVDVQLENGQISILGAEGSIDEVALTISAVATKDGVVTGTVTNTTPWTLQSTAVFAPGAAVLVGDLAPGASTTFELKNVKATANVESQVGKVWPNPQFGIGFDEPAPGVDYGIWSGFAARRQSDLYPVGFVRVAGWTKDRASDVTSSAEVDSVTLVTAISPIESGDIGLVPFLIPSQYVEPPWDPNSGQANDPVIKFEIPASAAGQRLQLKRLNNQAVKKVELLGADGKWTEVKSTGTDKDIVEIPPELVRSGVLLVRLGVDQNFGFDPSTAAVELRGVVQ